VSVCSLGIYEEAVGVLHDVEEVDGYILASIGPVVMALPAGLEAKLRPLIGERIGILRTEKDFRLRTFSVAKTANAAEGALKAAMSEV
jgi:hypothetical protein